MKTFLIRLLFKLLKVENATKNLIYLEDLKRIKPIEGRDIENDVKLKYYKALSSVMMIPHFLEWLYYQVIVKQREHIMTINKDKREHQRASILFILYLINEIQEADKELKKYKSRAEG